MAERKSSQGSNYRTLSSASVTFDLNSVVKVLLNSTTEDFVKKQTKSKESTLTA